MVIHAWSKGSEAPARAMSMTKSIVALLVAKLRDDGALSFDDPLTRWFPELVGTDRADLTVRDVLTMSTGLRPCDDLTACPGDGGDAVAAALALPRVAPRGVYAYDNMGINLASGVVSRAYSSSLSGSPTGAGSAIMRATRTPPRGSGSPRTTS